MTLDEIAKKLNKLHKLPPMPETAVRILNLSIDPETEVAQLAAVIERDPSLAAQVMRYARSALFSYRGELASVKDAVHFVLGFDRVSQIAFGLSAGKAFNIPAEGPLGLKCFWQHSLYCAVLAQAFALMADPDLEFDEREAYLSGLLHNFGILLIGHLLPSEFKGLNEQRENEPELLMSDIEHKVFGENEEQAIISLGHGSVGAVLLKLWKMPESVITVAGMHQRSQYHGPNQKYVELVRLVNSLLAERGIGDEPAAKDSKELMKKLGIQEDKCRDLLEVLLEQCQSLDGLISQMAA
jgi:HD-like signal output (HDOD) protein